MTQRWRGGESEKEAFSEYFRGGWRPGSLLVFNLDIILCSWDLRRGLITEGKHVDAVDKTWTKTRQIAQKLGWWSALFVYQTDNGRHWGGKVIRIDATFCSPRGRRHTVEDMDPDWFKQWVCRVLGAKPLR